MVVAELDGGENEALDLVPLVTNVVLEVLAVVFFHFTFIFSRIIVTSVVLEILDFLPSPT